MNTAANPHNPQNPHNTQNKSFKSSDAAAIGKRLQSELMSLMMAKVPGVSAFPEAENLLK